MLAIAHHNRRIATYVCEAVQFVHINYIIPVDAFVVASYFVNAVVTCEIKLFHNYFRGLLQLMNIFQHVQCR